MLGGTTNSNNVWCNRPLLNGYLSGLTLDQIDIGGQAYLPMGEQGWLSIGGSVARARLIANTNALFRSGDWTRSAFTLSGGFGAFRSEEHTSELQPLMRTSYAVFCFKKTKSQ